MSRAEISTTEQNGFEVWDASGNTMYASGKANNPDHAVELMQDAMKMFGDKEARGYLTQDFLIVDAYLYEDIMDSVA